MQTIKRLSVEEGLQYRKTIVQFIYESVKSAACEESYDISDAECKFSEMLSYMKEKKAIVCGAVDVDKLIGFVWGYEYPFRDDKSRLYVSILHVDKNFRNQKVGSVLLSRIEKEAKTLGYHSVFLHTEAFNTGAIRFYERMGYETERVQLVKKSLMKKERMF